MLFCTRRSRPVIDASASAAVAPGSDIGGGFELRGVERCDGGGRVELHGSADDGVSESVSIGDRFNLVLRT